MAMLFGLRDIRTKAARSALAPAALPTRISARSSASNCGPRLASVPIHAAPSSFIDDGISAPRPQRAPWLARFIHGVSTSMTMPLTTPSHINFSNTSA